MYYENYEDYMRSVLGYPVQNQYTYDSCMQNNNYSMQNINELQDLYPECYKVINPVVCNVCDNYGGNINNATIEALTDQVYQKISLNNEIMLKINIDNRSTNENKNIDNREIENQNKILSNNNLKTNSVDNSRNMLEVENRQRRPNNPFLRDLIRILILNRLLGGFFPGRPPMRPPFPGPGRPPFPGGPGGMPPRPPFQRNYEIN